MKTLMLILLFLVCGQVFAVSDAEISKSLDKMEESGLFTKEQLKTAREKLNSMTPEEKQILIEKGQKKAAEWTKELNQQEVKK